MCIEFDQHKLRLALTSNKHERLTDKHWIFSSGRLSLNELLYPTLNRGVGIGLLGTPPQKKNMHWKIRHLSPSTNYMTCSIIFPCEDGEPSFISFQSQPLEQQRGGEKTRHTHIRG